MKSIIPSKDLGEMVVRLLTRTPAPVPRGFLDRMLDKKKSPTFQTVLSDTLVWLHLLGRVHREFRQPSTHPECPETGVYFWPGDVEYDGFINTAPDFSKYHVESIIGETRTKPQPAAAIVEPSPELGAGERDVADTDAGPVAECVGSVTEDWTEVEVSVTTPMPVPLLAATASVAELLPQAEECEDEYDSTGDPGVDAELAAEIKHMRPAPEAPRQTLDEKILAFARSQLVPWSKTECWDVVSSDPAARAMRLALLVKSGKIVKGTVNKRVHYLVAGAEHVGFMPDVVEAPAPRKINTTPTVVEAHLTSPTLAKFGAPLQGTQLLRLDDADPEFRIESSQDFSIVARDEKGVRVHITLGPKTMEQFAAFGRRYNLFNQMGTT